jgi:hypothetical protein
LVTSQSRGAEQLCSLPEVALLVVRLVLVDRRKSRV